MSTIHSCVAIDDDSSFLKVADAMISKVPFLKSLGTFDDPEVGLTKLIESRPDIVFLDVEMPHLSGPEIISKLEDRPEIILITSHPSYALDAFELGVTDFLVKPVESFARFMKAVDRAMINLHCSYDLHSRQGDLLLVKEGNHLIGVHKSSILFIQAFGDYVKVFSKDNMRIFRSRLSQILNHLGDKFIRVHRSYIIQLDKIDRIENDVVIIGSHKIPISNSYKSAFCEWLEQ